MPTVAREATTTFTSRKKDVEVVNKFYYKLQTKMINLCSIFVCECSFKIHQSVCEMAVGNSAGFALGSLKATP